MATGSGKISELEKIGNVTAETLFEMVDDAGDEQGLDNYQGTASQVEQFINREEGAVRAAIDGAVEKEADRAKEAEQALFNQQKEADKELSLRQDDLAQAIIDEKNRAKEVEGDIALLETTDKSNLVAAVNTVKRGGNANAQEITKLQTRVADLGEYVDRRDEETLDAARAYTDGHNASETAHNDMRVKISSLETSEADIRDILLDLIGLPAWDSATHTLIFTARNNSQLVIDLPIESLAKDIGYDPGTKEIVLIRHDGTEIRVSVSDLIDVYEGSNGTHIQVNVDSGNVIRATLLGGSITESELSSALLQKINNKLDAGHNTDPQSHHDIRTAIEQIAAGGGGGGDSGMSETYTFVVDSDEALAAWATDAPGNDYSRVLIKAGTWTYNDPRTSGGSYEDPLAIIDISNGRTKSVVGESGSKIKISSNATFIACIKGAATENYSAYVDHGQFRNVTVVNGNKGCFFLNCEHLADCICIFDGIYNSYAVGFVYCTNLTNCTGNAGFNNCTNLINCTGVYFNNCTNLANCNGSYGFVYCKNLTNCTGSSRYNDAAFVYCYYLTNCTGSAGGGNSYSFHYCRYLTNCTGTSSATGTAFYECRYLVNCLGNANANANGFAFSHCLCGFACRADFTKGTSGFSSCYMRSGYNDRPWDNTEIGGYNGDSSDINSIGGGCDVKIETLATAPVGSVLMAFISLTSGTLIDYLLQNVTLAKYKSTIGGKAVEYVARVGGQWNPATVMENLPGTWQCIGHSFRTSTNYMGGDCQQSQPHSALFRRVL